MGYAKYHEDILRRLDEASAFLNFSAPPPTQVVNTIHETKPLTPKPGEWHSLRQQILGLLTNLKSELAELSELSIILNNPHVEIGKQLQKALAENSTIRQQNDKYKCDIAQLQDQLSKARQECRQYTGEQTAIELALQKAKSRKIDG